MAMEISFSPLSEQSTETDSEPPGPTCIEDLKKISIRLEELWMERHGSHPHRMGWSPISADIYQQTIDLLAGRSLYCAAKNVNTEDAYLIDTELTCALQVQKQEWFRRIGSWAVGRADGVSESDSM